MLAHVGGVPVEELLQTAAAGVGAGLLLARSWASLRLRRRPGTPRHVDQRGGDTTLMARRA